jgi:hypothetical protein
MQAILTRVIPATNTKPTRIKATCARGSITVTRDDVSQEAAHCWAANALCERFVAEDVKTYGSDARTNPWAGKRVSGCLPSGDYAHVFLPLKS